MDMNAVQDYLYVNGILTCVKLKYEFCNAAKRQTINNSICNMLSVSMGYNVCIVFLEGRAQRILLYHTRVHLRNSQYN